MMVNLISHRFTGQIKENKIADCKQPMEDTQRSTDRENTEQTYSLRLSSLSTAGHFYELSSFSNIYTLLSGKHPRRLLARNL